MNLCSDTAPFRNFSAACAVSDFAVTTTMRIQGLRSGLTDHRNV